MLQPVTTQQMPVYQLPEQPPSYTTAQSIHQNQMHQQPQGQQLKPQIKYPTQQYPTYNNQQRSHSLGYTNNQQNTTATHTFPSGARRWKVNQEEVQRRLQQNNTQMRPPQQNYNNPQHPPRYQPPRSNFTKQDPSIINAAIFRPEAPNYNTVILNADENTRQQMEASMFHCEYCGSYNKHNRKACKESIQRHKQLHDINYSANINSLNSNSLFFHQG
jgi:hypothetical protein